MARLDQAVQTSQVSWGIGCLLKTSDARRPQNQPSKSKGMIRSLKNRWSISHSILMKCNLIVHREISNSVHNRELYLSLPWLVLAIPVSFINWSWAISQNRMVTKNWRPFWLAGASSRYRRTPQSSWSFMFSERPASPCNLRGQCGYLPQTSANENGSWP